MIVLEFDNVDCNSEQADLIVNDISESCENIQNAFNADSCYIDDCTNARE